MISKFLSFMVGVVVIFMLLYYFVFFIVIVPSASMYPTVKIGDQIITTRIHDLSSINRGDILVFRSDELNETMIKRVIGLPNDKINIDTNGNIFVNDEKLNEYYVKYPDNRDGNYTVPEGEYFFLGDYREHSYDSRSWDDPFIPEENI
ncbi:Signal peptidase IB [bioreactor metagenome]|uniref:Signal peptidase IB n=1 Tax=bioreactor metagenome TaxID=1076179 RepID=A0A644WEN0_9ZZZZ